MALQLHSDQRQRVNLNKMDEKLCTGSYDYHFFATLMLEDLCVCMPPQESEEIQTLSIVQISLCLVGVMLILTLMVSSALVNRSFTAVLSILMLYNLLLLCSQGLLFSFAVIGMKDFTQMIYNAIWILGTWDIRCTALEMGVVLILNTFWPNMTPERRKSLKVVKRTSLVFLIGLLVCGWAFIEAIMKTKSWSLLEVPRSCDKEEYYYLYQTAYQMFLVMVLWLIPVVSQAIIFLALLVQLLKINL